MDLKDDPYLGKILSSPGFRRRVSFLIRITHLWILMGLILFFIYLILSLG